MPNELQRRCQTVENGISDSGNTCQTSPHDLCLGIADWGLLHCECLAASYEPKTNSFSASKKGELEVSWRSEARPLTSAAAAPGHRRPGVHSTDLIPRGAWKGEATDTDSPSGRSRPGGQPALFPDFPCIPFSTSIFCSFFYKQFSMLPVRIFCATVRRCAWNGHRLRVYVTEIKNSLSTNCCPSASLAAAPHFYPLAVLWLSCLLFFVPLPPFVPSFSAKRFSCQRQFFMVCKLRLSNGNRQTK